MQAATENLIDVNEFCIYHNVEISFIHSLHQSGLLETVVIKETIFIRAEQLQHLEKLSRLHYEMDINLEGIEAITHLLQRINEMQTELSKLRNQLES